MNQIKTSRNRKMKVNFSYTEFYQELESSLPASTAEQRKMWAATIVAQDIDIKNLSELLKREQKIASRFLWLLSEIGELNPNKLFNEIPFLWYLCNHHKPDYKTSFATYWLIAGVPSEMEGKAITLLFQWLLSAETNVTTKSRAILVLFKLTKKYPELESELKLCLKDQIDKHSIDFQKRTAKILTKISNI